MNTSQVRNGIPGKKVITTSQTTPLYDVKQVDASKETIDPKTATIGVEATHDHAIDDSGVKRASNPGSVANFDSMMKDYEEIGS